MASPCRRRGTGRDAEGPIDLDRIRVSLASIGEHRAADIEFLDVMRSIRLRLHHGGDGPVIRVTSKDAIREPVLSFLVELASRQGRMLREYVVLLDPPGYRILPRRTPRRSTRPTQATRATRAMAPKVSQEIAPASDEAPIAPVPGAGERYGPVKAGDTLSELGFRLRPDPEVAGAQMAWALFESNPDAFINADVDKLMSGMYLRIPTREQALNTRYELAFAQVHGRQPAPSRPTPSSVSVRDGVVATSDAPARVTPPAGTDVPVRPAPAPISADLSESGVSPESPESAPESAPESGEPTEPAPAEAGSAEDPAPAATAGGLKLLTREEELALETVESAAPREGDEESRLRDLLGRLQVEIAASNKETARVHERLTLLEQTIKELRGLIASKDQEIVRLQTVVSELQATSKQAAALEWLESNTVQRLAIEAAILLIAVLVMGWGAVAPH